MSDHEPTKAEVLALLTRWTLREFTSQEVHESAELLIDNAPPTPTWPGVAHSDPRWGPRTVVDLLSDLASGLLFPEDVPALRALLDDAVGATNREAAWKAHCSEVDWEARRSKATSLPYYRLWHR